MFTPQAPDMTFFWGFTLLHGLDLPILSLSNGLYNTWLLDFRVLFWIIYQYTSGNLNVIHHHHLGNSGTKCHLDVKISHHIHYNTTDMCVALLNVYWYTSGKCYIKCSMSFKCCIFGMMNVTIRSVKCNIFLTPNVALFKVQ